MTFTVVTLDKINIGVVDSKINEDENENCDSNDVLVAHEIGEDDYRMYDYRMYDSHVHSLKFSSP